MTTINEAAEIINKEFAGCFAFIEGKNIEVTVRGKKSDKVYVLDGKVSYKGNCAVTAGAIAERFNLIKNW